jgi:hypothetical protein
MDSNQAISDPIKPIGGTTCSTAFQAPVTAPKSVSPIVSCDARRGDGEVSRGLDDGQGRGDGGAPEVEGAANVRKRFRNAPDRT